jgi:hypothetical protein
MTPSPRLTLFMPTGSGVSFCGFLLHFCVFSGSLVTVKYVRDERYAERFPEMIGK